MTAQASFASIVNTGVAIAPATNDTSLTAPSNTTTLFMAGASGSRVDEIDVIGLGTTVAGRLNIFLVRSGAFKLINQQLITAVTPSASLAVFSVALTFTNLQLKSGDTLAISVMEAGNESLLQVNAYGGDY